MNITRVQHKVGMTTIKKLDILDLFIVFTQPIIEKEQERDGSWYPNYSDWKLQTGKHVFRMSTDLMNGNMTESAEILLLVDAGQLQRNHL